MRLLNGSLWLISDTGRAVEVCPPVFMKSKPPAVSPYTEVRPAPVLSERRKSVSRNRSPTGRSLPSSAPKVPSLSIPTRTPCPTSTDAASEIPGLTVTSRRYPPVVSASAPVVTSNGSYPVFAPSLTPM